MCERERTSSGNECHNAFVKSIVYVTIKVNSKVIMASGVGQSVDVSFIITNAWR